MSLPNGWKKKSALDVLTLQGGYAFKSTDAQSSGVKWLKIANVGISQIKWEDESFLPYEFWEEHPNFQLNDGDIVVAMTRPLLGLKLKIARLGKADVPALLNQRVGRILPSSGVDKDFIYQTLTTKTVAKQFDADLLGTDPPNLGVQTFKRTKILLPPLPEQKAIADLLSTWDSAIEKTERLIAAKEKRFQWLLDELINQNLNKHNWKNSSFAEIFEPSKNKYDASGELPVLSVTKDGIVLQSEYFNKEIASDDLNGYLIVDYNDFVMSGLNFWMGSVDFQTIVDRGLVSPAYKVYKVISKSIDMDFLKIFVRSTSMTNLLVSVSVQGASIVRRNLDKEMLENSVIKAPSLSKQKEIAGIIISAQKEIDLLKTLAKKYKQQKRGLMQKLLTGEWRVKVN